MTVSRVVRSTPVATALGVGLIFAAAAPAQAAKIAVVGGTAVFTAANNETNIIQAGSADGIALTVSDSGAKLIAGAGCVQLTLNSASCAEPADGPRPLTIDAGNLGDTITVSEFASRPVTILGKGGDDTALVSSHVGSSPTIDGGAGNDTLTANMNSNEAPTLIGGTGDDELFLSRTDGGQAIGGDGDDRIRYLGSNLFQSLSLNGGGGDDTYVFERDFRPASMVAGPGQDTLDQSAWPGFFGSGLSFDLATCLGCVETVIGSAFDDQISGDNAAQTIFGGDGNDTISGGGGRDRLSGDGGDDTITAADNKADVVNCGAGLDSVFKDRLDVINADCETVTRS